MKNSENTLVWLTFILTAICAILLVANYIKNSEPIIQKEYHTETVYKTVHDTIVVHDTTIQVQYEKIETIKTNNNSFCLSNNLNYAFELDASDDIVDGDEGTTVKYYCEGLYKRHISDNDTTSECAGTWWKKFTEHKSWEEE